MRNSRSQHSRGLRCGVVVVSLGLIGSACGGDEPTGANSAVSVAVDAGEADVPGASSAQIATGDIDIPEGMTTTASLIPELTGLPVPDGAVFTAGVAYTEDQDPRQTAIQQVFVSMPSEEVIAFYLDELPKAGYAIVPGGVTEKSEIVVGVSMPIVFDDPAGLPGQVIIGPGTFAESQLNINLFRGGVR